ncbi:MAG TPA: Flp family type IVb pilin [Nocardioides sp.]|nr:Flp family type IVb pilin [Nocardioides sp.]
MHGGNRTWSLELVEERGATSVEYALLITLIAVGIVVAVALLGDAVQELFTFDFPGG